MERNKPLRLVIDTNLWISFVISNKLKKLDDLLKSFFPTGTVEEMFRIIEPISEMVKPTSKVEICRDPYDDFLLALSKDGKADFLITGDRDLFTLHKFEKTTIITFSELATTLQLT